MGEGCCARTQLLILLVSMGRVLLARGGGCIPGISLWAGGPRPPGLRAGRGGGGEGREAPRRRHLRQIPGKY